MTTRSRYVAIVMLCMTWPLSAQRTATRPGETMTATATITKLDAAKRFLVLRDDDGSDVGVFAPPEFSRFEELMVGDRVTLTYYESIVHQLKSRRAPKVRVSEAMAATESAGTFPGATFSHQSTERVTVKAVDTAVPSITVVTRDGRVASKKVEDGSLLEGVKPGDHIDITYTEALLATVTRAK
jgi:hypothetical protein